MWEAQASKPGSPDRTTDHTPMRTKPRLIPATCMQKPENGERPPRCQRRALEDDRHEIDYRVPGVAQ